MQNHDELIRQDVALNTVALQQEEFNA